MRPFVFVFKTDCEPPVSPVNGTALKIGSVTSFSCNTGSTLLGANQITCSNSGQGWSATPPVCGKSSYCACTFIPKVYHIYTGYTRNGI
ncbi:hypothetical protein DPMN_114007 [Dreissena polymorpha]|uniref:Sushi domain-containing protein n=1 Tax=Dreissena polymorpha TaxID=45954 RepID=A0A9D4QS21_DREPO|nr:hypothetical protein DPMN_114007 [Dreissena polymorpha]